MNGMGWKWGYSTNAAIILTLAVLLLGQVAIIQYIGTMLSYHRHGGLLLEQQERHYQIGLGSAEAQVSDDTNSNVDNREVSIVSISSRYDLEMGAFHVFGELMNKLDFTVNNVSLNATFYDAGGNIIGNAFARPFIDYLRPQEKSAFDIALYESAAGALREYSYYKILKTWDSAQEPKLGLLDLDLRDIVLDTCGYYHFMGTVGNFGKEPTREIILSAAFYNERNQIIKSGHTSVIKHDESLPSIKYAPFALLIDSRALSEFTYYSFNIQSDEYASRVLDDKDDDPFNYQNGPSPPSAASDMTIMTVATEESMYRIGPNEISVFGKIPIVAEDWYDHHRNSFVLIKLMSPSGLVHERATAPIGKDGSYSANIDFRVNEGSEGQVYRVRAEYKGNAAENNFAIGFGNAGNSEASSADDMGRACKPADLSIGWSSWTTINANNTLNGSSDNSTGDALVEGVMKLGSTVILSVVAENKMTDAQPLITVIEVFDADGKAVFLHLERVLLDPTREHQTNIPWKPDGLGEYKIKSFVISGLDEPRILSHSLNMMLRVL